MLLTKPRQYQPQLPDFLSLCERNYARLNRLLPADFAPGLQWGITINPQQHYQLTVLECGPFTTRLQIESVTAGQPISLDNFVNPGFDVQLYHDAQLAEVVRVARYRKFAPRYSYPNPQMMQPDEKRQINLLLADWLKLCISQGYNAAAVELK
ncbi:hypothetical protein SAMN06297280_2082 [Arsukibacterium tuosuense]|uniref:Dehydrogenase n=1 Tax=Arsukibacterium tuosuense TaxID=1323745 RepID=A0A285IWH0_9GAMM|nr:DUF1249 domain-containing protein [Arsukibacterium tuosuense]SNY52332.1 hypothetical protein SAMN06297280_2082 [Arsukibacterium tuosuense]